MNVSAHAASSLFLNALASVGVSVASAQVTGPDVTTGTPNLQSSPFL